MSSFKWANLTYIPCPSVIVLFSSELQCRSRVSRLEYKRFKRRVVYICISFHCSSINSLQSSILMANKRRQLWTSWSDLYSVIYFATIFTIIFNVYLLWRKLKPYEEHDPHYNCMLRICVIVGSVKCYFWCIFLNYFKFKLYCAIIPNRCLMPCGAQRGTTSSRAPRDMQPSARFVDG